MCARHRIKMLSIYLTYTVQRPAYHRLECACASTQCCSRIDTHIHTRSHTRSDHVKLTFSFLIWQRETFAVHSDFSLSLKCFHRMFPINIFLPLDIRAMQFHNKSRCTANERGTNVYLCGGCMGRLNFLSNTFMLFVSRAREVNRMRFPLSLSQRSARSSVCLCLCV